MGRSKLTVPIILPVSPVLYLKVNPKMNILVSLLLTAAQVLLNTDPALSCSAAKHPHFLARQPQLFRFSQDMDRGEKLCMKQEKGEVVRTLLDSMYLIELQLMNKQFRV